jgi:hypothetical protein
MDLHRNIADFFDGALGELNCQQDTRAYIVGIFGKYRTIEWDLSHESLTLYFAKAREHQDFARYQACGDWVFFCQVLMPEQLGAVQREYYQTLARISYYSCYRLLNRQWKSFEELADNFVPLEREVAQKLKPLIAF